MPQFYQRYKEHYKANIYLAFPVVISQLGHTLVQTADSVIVGHFAGTVALAAVALVNSIFIITLVLGIGISYGITPLIAQHNGRNEYEACGQLLSNSLLINIISGIVLFIVVYFGSMYAISHLDQSPEVVQQARPYLFLLGLSLVPLLIFNTFKQFTEGLGFTKQAMMISIWGNLLNICLGITFVKGLFGIHPMGVSGVGYSTLIDRCVMAVAMALYVFKSARFKTYLKGFAIQSINWMQSLQILKIGAPVGMQYLFEVSAFGGAAIMIGRIGVIPQAAHQVAISLAAITYMMASGISAAAAIKSGNFFGNRDFKTLKLSAMSSYHMALLFMGCTAVLFALANHLLPWVYTNDTRVIVIASHLLLIAAVFQLFDGAQVVGLGILRGMGDVNIPTLITFLAYWVVGLPVGYWLGIHLHWGVNGVWYGLTSGLLVAAVLLYARFIVLSKKHVRSINIVAIPSEINIIG
jgi:MATE family multidrug resistance protein